jgi:hypothetical protein
LIKKACLRDASEPETKAVKPIMKKIMGPRQDETDDKNINQHFTHFHPPDKV